MFGYILAILIGAGVLVLILIGLVGGNQQERGRSPEGKGRERPVEPAAPAADEPTPDRSVTATGRQVEEVRKRTPPA